MRTYHHCGTSMSNHTIKFVLRITKSINDELLPSAFVVLSATYLNVIQNKSQKSQHHQNACMKLSKLNNEMWRFEIVETYSYPFRYSNAVCVFEFIAESRVGRSKIETHLLLCIHMNSVSLMVIIKTTASSLTYKCTHELTDDTKSEKLEEAHCKMI